MTCGVAITESCQLPIKVLLFHCASVNVPCAVIWGVISLEVASVTVTLLDTTSRSF